MASPIVLLGSSLTAKGAWTARAAAPGAVAGLSAGKTSTNPKRWACEDSVALLPLDDGATLCAVADAHFGGLTGELVAGGLARAWEEAGPGDVAGRLDRALLRLDAELRRRPRDDESETTALLVHRRGSTVTWANVGDSFLLLVAGGACALRNRIDHRFMGGRSLPTPRRELGAFELGPGELLLLSSDGLEEEMLGLSLDEVARRLSSAEPLLARVEGLLRHASEVGADNLGLVALPA